MLRDEQLVARAQAGDRQAANEVVSRFRNMCRGRIDPFYLPGGDRDDLLQEAYIGLLEAIDRYDPDRGPFVAFARLCVDRKVWSALKAANRHKQRTLTYSARTPPPDLCEDQSDSTDWLPGADVFEQREHVHRLNAIVALSATLTPLERSSLVMVLDGVQYRGDRSIDNAIQRARRKLRPALDADRLEAAA